MTYTSESTALDREVLALIERWHPGGAPVDERDFEDLALRILAHQLRYNDAYARYAGTFGYSAASLPTSWHDIPAVPAAAYKEATLATFDPSRAALAFETSGTTQGAGGRHYMETRSLYDASLLAGFDRFMLPDGARLRYLNLVPNPALRPQSSLGYMMARVSADRGDGNTGWYLRDEDIFVEAFIADVQAAIADDQPVCIASTAFALVHVLDALEQRSLILPLPAGSRIMETGGFKGRSRIVERDALYAELRHRFVCPDDAIIAEYGMTELTSQYYDAVPLGARYKVSPPWLRVRVVGPDGRSVRNGIVGSLVHVDLANRSSCVAIATEDLGAAFDEGLVLIGRERGAALRGCSLDAEALRRR
jgi:hypothetical protein